MRAANPAPLAIPGGLNTNPSMIEKAARWIPLVGWIVANELEKRRYHSVSYALSKQLERRTGIQIIPEPGDPAFTSYRYFVAGVVKDVFEWPNDLFILEDPFELMLFDDDGAGIEVFQAVESYLGLPTNSLIERDLVDIKGRTFGEVLMKTWMMAGKRNPWGQT